MPALGDQPETLPLLPLLTVPLFPGTSSSLDVGRGTPASMAIQHAFNRSRRDRSGRMVAVATMRENHNSPPLEQLHPIAMLGEIAQIQPGMPGRLSVLVRGLHRISLLSVSSEREFQLTRVVRTHEPNDEPTLAYALSGALQDLIKQHDNLLPASSKTKARNQALQTILAQRSPGLIADLCAAHIELEVAERLVVLQEASVAERLRKVIEFVSHRSNVLQVKRDLDRYVRDLLSRHEQESLLRHKLRAIQSELGEAPGASEELRFRELEERLRDAELPAEAQTTANRQLARLRRMNPQSSEATTTRTYLEWLSELPWSEKTATPEKLELKAARALLETQHYGLEKVKKRIFEYLSVRKLAPRKRGPILCLVGPPGVGKTSLGHSIAEALGRQLVRISLGGVRDDAEIRGHRRTYVGALPGRLIQAMKRAGSINPVIVLDEVDKLSGPSMRGDPASALLEALDPEQNDAFSDHYLAVDYDLSRVIFLCTANDLSGIPPVLRDRFEVIQLTGYTIEEKIHIARDYLMPRGVKEHGLEGLQIDISDEVLSLLATGYTNESGVRNLQRELASILRDLAMHIAEGKHPVLTVTIEDVARILGPPKYHPQLAEKEPRPGVVTGLGWTATGGTLLFVEATLTRGSGKLRLTGRLGDVMKESAQAALSLVRSRAKSFGIDPNFMSREDIHIHLPSGAVPKDGPSAGIAVTTAIISVLTRRAVRVDVAMTGEITLTGHVLPIGGVREKLLAAHRAGIREIILPERNRKDEPDIPKRARQDLTIYYVRTIHDVLALMLLPKDETAAA